MSYDLYFRSSDGRVDADKIRRWFTERPNYTVADDQAWYENTVSGVYFSFRLATSDSDPLSFNLNYFRPDIFAREARPEVAALIEAFDLDIHDPQSEGMGDTWSPDGFLRGWRHGNRFAHQVLVQQTDAPTLLTLPLATNVGVWQWNRAREAYLDRLGTLDMLPCFVPTIFLLVPEAEDGPVRTAVVWAEQMQIALPEVDLVLAMNQQGARPDAIPFDRLRPLLDRFEHRAADHEFTLDGSLSPTGLPHWLLDWEAAPPADLARILTSGRFEPFKRVSAGDVLDRETLEHARLTPLRTGPEAGEA